MFGSEADGYYCWVALTLTLGSICVEARATAVTIALGEVRMGGQQRMSRHFRRQAASIGVSPV
jgi:hypothetical protein